MTLWLMRQHLQQGGAWFVTALGTMCILQWPLAGFSMMTLVIVVQLIMIPGRATVFDAALPLSARDIVAARLFAKLLLISIPTIAWVATWERGLGDLLPLSRFLEVMAIVVLVALLPHCVRPGVVNLSTRTAYVWPLAVMAVISGLIFWLVPATVGAVMLGSAVAALVSWTIATVPSSFERVASEGGGVAKARKPTVRAPSTRIRAWLPVLQSMVSVELLMYFGFALLSSWLGNWPVYLLIFSVSAYHALRQRTAWLATLPLSHRARLAVIVIPFCLLPLAGLAIGRALPSRDGGDRRMSADAAYTYIQQGRYYWSPTRVPLTYWLRMPTRPLPAGATRISQHVEIVAPWGERVVADTFSILGTTYFDPFTTTNENSTRFVEWQFAKATTAVYGQPISRRVYEDESIALPPHVVDAWSVQLLGAGLTLTLLLYILLASELALSATASRWKVPLASSFPILLAMLPMCTIGGICMYYSRGHHGSLFISMLERILLVIVRALPDNMLVVGLAAAIPPAILYVLLDRQFSLSEVSRSPVVRR